MQPPRTGLKRRFEPNAATLRRFVKLDGARLSSSSVTLDTRLSNLQFDGVEDDFRRRFHHR